MDSPTDSWEEDKEPPKPPKKHWWRCVRCGHLVEQGSIEFRALRSTASPIIFFGVCQTCVVRKREAKRAGGPLPKDTPVVFKLVLEDEKP